MSKYLVTYHGSGMPDDPAQMVAAKNAFMAWVQGAGSAIVDPGAPLHTGAQVATGAPAPSVSVGGYSIIEAPDEAAAVAILRGHPYVSRGGTLQLHQVIDV